MCVCVYVCVQVCVCVYECVCVGVCKCVDVRVHVCESVSVVCYPNVFANPFLRVGFDIKLVLAEFNKFLSIYQSIYLSLSLSFSLSLSLSLYIYIYILMLKWLMVVNFTVW